MRVLVTAASKYGSTQEIAEAIGATLRERGLEAAALPADRVDGVDGYDAVVIGSGVYAGHWLGPAKDLVDRVAGQLVERPVWLFSSGPIGDPPKPTEDPVDVAAVLRITRAKDHRVFAGKLVKRHLSFGERAIVMAVRAPEGDYRDWERSARGPRGSPKPSGPDRPREGGDGCPNKEGRMSWRRQWKRSAPTAARRNSRVIACGRTSRVPPSPS